MWRNSELGPKHEDACFISQDKVARGTETERPHCLHLEMSTGSLQGWNECIEIIAAVASLSLSLFSKQDDNSLRSCSELQVT
jgi:hypothetical protein